MSGMSSMDSLEHHLILLGRKLHRIAGASGSEIEACSCVASVLVTFVLMVTMETFCIHPLSAPWAGVYETTVDYTG